MVDMTDAEREQEYTLPEQRHRVSVDFGGISTWHVVLRSTVPTTSHPGRYTRRAADRRTLCGSMTAMLVGIDASTWPTERQPVENIKRVDCKRCLASYAHWLAKHEKGKS